MAKSVKFGSSVHSEPPVADVNTYPRSSLKLADQNTAEQLKTGSKSLIERVYGCEVNVDSIQLNELVSCFMEAREPLTMRYAVLNRVFGSGNLAAVTPELLKTVLTECLDQTGVFIASSQTDKPADGRVSKELSTMLLCVQNMCSALKSKTQLSPLVSPVLQILQIRSNTSVELVKTCIGAVNMFMDTSLLSQDQARTALKTISLSTLRLTGCHSLLRRVDTVYSSLLEEHPSEWVPLALKLFFQDESARQTALQLLTKHETIKTRSVLNSCLAAPYKPNQPECTYRAMLALMLKKLLADQQSCNQSLQIWSLLVRTDSEPSQWLWFVEHCYKTIGESQGMIWAVVANNNVFEGVLAFIRLCADREMPLNECLQYICEAAGKTPMQHAKDLINAAVLVCLAREADPAVYSPVIAKLIMQFVESGISIDHFAFNDVLHILEHLMCTAKTLSSQNRVFLRCAVEQGLKIDVDRLAVVYQAVLNKSALERKSPVFLSALVAADAETLNMFIARAFVSLDPVETEIDPIIRPSYFSQLFATNEKRERVLIRYFQLLTERASPGSSKWVLAEEWALAASLLMKTNVKSEYAPAFLACFDSKTTNEQAWTQWQLCFNLNISHGSEYLYTIKHALSWPGLKAILSLEGFDEVRARIIVVSLDESNVDNLRSALPSCPKVWDECIRRLGSKWGSRGFEKKSKLAVKLAGSARMRLLARNVLQRLAITRNTSTNDYTAVVTWNQEIAPALASLQHPIITAEQRETLISRIPGLAIPRAACTSPPQASPQASTQASTPPQNKRRKMILTGTLPESTLTPPPSSQDAGSESSIDIPSSPPPDVNAASNASSTSPAKSFDPARMLKRTMLGLDIQDAARSMTRAEQTMIYNIMFRSCMWLKTHLAETRDQPVTEAEVSAAKLKLDESIGRLPEPQKHDLTQPIDGTCLDLALSALHK